MLERACSGVAKWRGKRTGVSERKREKLTEGDVADVLGPLQSWDVADLKRWFSVRVCDLRCALKRLQLACIYKFLLSDEVTVTLT